MGQVVFRHSDTVRKAFGALGLFGGTEFLNVIFSVVRTKLVALWIGPAGVGLFGLFNTALEMIGAFVQIGFRTSAVRNIAAAGSGNMLSRIVTIVRRWGLLLGAVTLAIAVVAAPLLSYITFGIGSYKGAFAALGVALLFNSVAASEKAVLQGSGMLKRLANASVCGVIFGFAVSVPMLYFWRIDSVVPVILAYSLAACVAVWIGRWRNTDKCEHEQKVSFNETYKVGIGFLKLGFYLTVSGFITWAAGYIFMTYLNNTDGEISVGLYQAGYTLLVRYVGLIFAAIGMEYFPRLAAAVLHGKCRAEVFMRHETVIMIYVMTPLSALFAAFSPWIVQLLYSSDFMAVVPMICIGAIGSLLRGASWCMAYMIVARGDGKIYMLTEIFSGIMCVFLNILGYELLGLAGVGVAFVVWYAVYGAVILLVVKSRYGVTLHRKQLWLLFICIALVAFVAILSLFVSVWSAAIPVTFIVFVSALRVRTLFVRR